MSPFQNEYEKLGANVCGSGNECGIANDLPWPRLYSRAARALRTRKLPWQKLPRSIVMSTEDMVDAALVGLDQGELVTIPILHDGYEWTRFEAARRAISKKFGNSQPALRYEIAMRRSA